MRKALLILGLLAALAVPAVASADKTPIASSICGSTGQGDCGSGNGAGCATVASSSGDGYGDWVTAYYHWCWNTGAIWDAYGWGDYGLGSAFNSFNGWSANTGIPNGHLVIGHFDGVTFNLFGVKVHHDASARACLQVDGWGQSWGC